MRERGGPAGRRHCRQAGSCPYSSPLPFRVGQQKPPGRVGGTPPTAFQQSGSHAPPLLVPQTGQFIGARGDFVPEQICRKLSLLHDQVRCLCIWFGRGSRRRRCHCAVDLKSQHVMCTLQVPPMPAQQARQVIEKELGAPLDAVFEWIELEEPLGSASISQVSLCPRPPHTSVTPSCQWWQPAGQSHGASRIHFRCSSLPSLPPLHHPISVSYSTCAPSQPHPTIPFLSSPAPSRSTRPSCAARASGGGAAAPSCDLFGMRCGAATRQTWPPAGAPSLPCGWRVCVLVCEAACVWLC